MGVWLWVGGCGVCMCGWEGVGGMVCECVDVGGCGYTRGCVWWMDGCIYLFK